MVRNILIFIILLLIIAAVIVMCISSYIGWDLSHPERQSIPVFSANIVPEYNNITFKDINDTLTLKGWFFEVKGSKRTVILAHGYGNNRLQFDEDTLVLVKAILNEGYNVMTFDFRNSGESEGNLTSVGLFEKDDLLGAIKYVKNKGSDEIVLLGFSMGASTSILVAAENNDVNAVIADSPFADLTQYLKGNLSVWSKLPAVPFNDTTLLSMKILTGVDTSKVSPVKVVDKISPRPILLIHSKDDTIIPIQSSYDLLKSAGNTAELWETEGVGHIGSFRGFTDEYIKRVVIFLNKLNEQPEE
jgi:pimeloyl-ACP methyl ester carboxylesterase